MSGIFGLQRGLISLLLATTLGTPAYAADPPAKKAPVKQSKSKQKPMSRDQLRACMDEQDRVLALRESVLKDQAALDEQRAQVARMDAELERRRASLDPADVAAKQSVSDEETKRNALGDAYNARLPMLKERGEALDQARQGWVGRCADKDFDELDEAFIKRERQRAARAGGK